MNIAICFDKNYQKWATVCLNSIWYNNSSNSEIRLFILTDLNYDQCILQLKNALKNFQFTFENPGSDFDKLPTGFHFKTAVYWRLKLPSILSKYGVAKVIYLDLDILVFSDLNRLFELELGASYIGAVIDVCSADNVRRMKLAQGFAINSGVLVMNVLKMNSVNWVDEANRLNNEGRIRWVDQDVINIVLDEKIKPIDIIWNVQSGNLQNGYEGEINIIHFTESNNSKPWKLNSSHRYLNVYNSYIRMSGFYFDYIILETVRRIRKYINGKRRNRIA